ncbi:MAG: hypothetical protein MRZ61_10865 [Oscillospiraceae bacterium]|nr:hypothetical protein [Oscillospiraceae bacterium]
MTAKEFLSQYGVAVKRIKLNRERMLNAERTAEETGRRSFYGYVSDYQDRLYGENEELIKLKISIELAVEKCPCTETEREVLYRRFILCEKWGEIADEMLYSLQHLHRLEKSALAKVRVPK